MKIELDELEVLDLLLLVKKELYNCQNYFKEFPDETQGLKTPQEVESVYNKILAAVKEGTLYNLIIQS